MQYFHEGCYAKAQHKNYHSWNNNMLVIVTSSDAKLGPANRGKFEFFKYETANIWRKKLIFIWRIDLSIKLMIIFFHTIWRSSVAASYLSNIIIIIIIIIIIRYHPHHHPHHHYEISSLWSWWWACSSPSSSL